MSCVNVQYIDGDECIGASLPKINGNFAALSAAVCNLSANVPDASVNVVDSPTIDLDWNASTRTLSASVLSINSLFVGANQSKTTNGYQKLPGDLIIQWGTANVSGESSSLVTLPVSFPTTALAAYATVKDTAPDNAATSSAKCQLASLTQLYVVHDQYQAVTATQIYWLAIGY